MDLQDFRKDFIEDVKSTALNDLTGTVESFVKIAADNLVEIQVIPDFETCFYVGEGKRGRKLRVDGYSLDEFDLSLNLVTAIYSGNEEVETLIRTEANQSFERTMAFVDEAINGKLKDIVEISRPEYDLVDLLRMNKERIRKYRCILVTDKLMSGRIDSFPIGDFNGVHVEYSIWDIERFFKVWSSIQAREMLEINFSEYISNGIPCLDANNAVSKGYRCYLCVLPAIVIADIYDRYGSKLLEGNVRSFLSTKVAVNKKIRETILSDPTMFFAYNNGIAATATDVVIEKRDNGMYLTYAKDLQIVNGGQTTASLSSARHKDKAKLEGIYVQMKLTEVDPVLANDIIPKISRSSNSQNKVSEADFFSNHAFHVRVEQISRRLYAPAVGGAQHDTLWFYERARGQYLQAQMKMTKKEKEKYQIQNPKSQLITKTDLAKYQNSWRCLPHTVSKGAQTNFMDFAETITKEWEENDAQFNEMFYMETVALAILFHSIEKIVDVQPWYEKGYRANIVTYTVALLSHLLKKGYPNKRLNMQMIWNKQKLPDILSNQLVVLTKLVFGAIIDPTRETINVTQWCKREACWKRMKSLDVDLLKGIEDILISKEEDKEIAKDARKTQVLTNEIEAQTFVVNKGEAYWSDMLLWASEKRKISAEEAVLMKKATKMYSGKLPNSYECQKLQHIKERLISEGFIEKVI
ncbi:MAG: hypothetical protein K0R69_2077 [Clostridia bacterium]|jgi:hypothetical protein|nr:hypothetical protein [Clostridia bacterium]